VIRRSAPLEERDLFDFTLATQSCLCYHSSYKCHHDERRRAMVRTQVQLTDDQMRTLKRLAAERGVSLAELVRQGVDLLVKSAGAGDHEEQRRRALAAAGRFRSGLGDLAIEHDRYLARAAGK
jgi:gamma-glutamyl:cysteine ligase YbdK (ATP-grasp superfamily)